MKVIKKGEVPEETVNAPIFTGGTVTMQPIVTKELAKDFAMCIVNFSQGARNKFHTHTGDQVLIVTAGKGIVATEQEELVVGVGDIIYFPAGEKHWHGAAENSEMSHLAIEAAGGELTQLEE